MRLPPLPRLPLHSIVPLCAAALLATGTPAHASSPVTDDSKVLFSAGSTPSGYDQVVQATFTRDADATSFRLRGQGIRGGAAGHCRDTVAGDGTALVTCEFGYRGADTGIRLVLNWTAGGARAEGTLHGAGSSVRLDRTVTPDAGQVWQFRINGRTVASMDQSGIELANGLPPTLERDILAAAFIIQHMG